MRTQRLVLAAFFAALPVVLSFFPGSIPVAGARVLPWQHMINVIAGVMLGPWYAALSATVAAILRNAFGVGTLLAFPGGIPGALVVGFAYRFMKTTWAGVLEPLGTGPIGATIGALLVAPMLMGRTPTLAALMSAFLASSVAGTVVGVIVVKALERLDVIPAAAGRSG